jgi:hypothetical protein
MLAERVKRNLDNGLPRLSAPQPRNDGNEKLNCSLKISLSMTAVNGRYKNNLRVLFMNNLITPRWQLWPLILACLLPVLVTTLWLIKNTQLPGNDASNYLMTATTIYHHFTDQGFWHGLVSCYLERGWRPIFFPVLAVPFLLISHGNLYFAYAAVALLGLLTTVIYAYLFFRLQLDRFSAIVAANFIGLLPLLQAQFVMFYAEGALFPCLLASIYHLIKSDFFRNKKQAYAFMVFAALAFMLRPIEVVTQLIFVMLVFLGIGYQRAIFSSKQLVMIAAYSLLSIFLFFAVTALPYFQFKVVAVMGDAASDHKMAMIIAYGLIGSGIASAVIFGLLKLSALATHQAKKAENYLLPVFLGMLALILIWFLPFAGETFQWIYRTSLGDVASSTGSLNGASFSWSILQIYVLAEGTLAVAGVFGLTLLGFITLSSSQRKFILLSLPVVYLLLTIPFPFWEAFYTVQIVTRKLSFAFPALLMAMLLIGLHQGRAWSYRIIVMKFLLVTQFALVIYQILVPSPHHANKVMNTLIGYFVPVPVTLNPNPHTKVIKFLTEAAKKYNLHNIGIEVNPGTPDARHPLEAEPIDPFLLSTMIESARQSYSVSYPYFSLFAEDNARELTTRYDAIFLSDRVSDMQVTPAAAELYAKRFQDEISPSLKTFDQFLIYYAKNQLSALNWQLGPCVVVESIGEGEYLGCLLLRK